MKLIIKVVALSFIACIPFSCSKYGALQDAIPNKWWDVDSYTVDGIDSTAFLKADTAYREIRFNLSQDDPSTPGIDIYRKIWQNTGNGNYRVLGINWILEGNRVKELVITNVSTGSTIWDDFDVLPIEPFKKLTRSIWEICTITDDVLQITLSYDNKHYILTFKKVNV